MRRKGELSRAMIDRQWPHQVALDASFVRDAYHTIERVIREMDHSPRRHSVVYHGPDRRRRDRWHVIFCFRDPEDAQRFRWAFDGLDVDPRDIGMGRAWHVWRPQPKPRDC